jgi:thioredoxin reductase
MRDLVIIGGGAAGMSAAIVALSKNVDVVVLSEQVGGKSGTQQHFSDQVGDEYLVGTEAVALFERRVLAHEGVVVRDRSINIQKASIGFRIETQLHGAIETRALIAATGTTPIMLDVPGARDLLNYGIGYSPSTHAHALAGRTVAVIGATRRALWGAIELARTATQVYLLAPHIEGLQTPFAGVQSSLAHTLRQLDNVTFMEGYEIKAIAGKNNVEHIVIRREGEGDVFLRVDAVFADFGLLPNSFAVRSLVQTDPQGFIVVDERNATSTPGIFAAGDVTTAFCEQVLIAVGDGARAATSAYHYLLTQPDPDQIEASD